VSCALGLVKRSEGVVPGSGKIRRKPPKGDEVLSPPKAAKSWQTQSLHFFQSPKINLLSSRGAPPQGGGDGWLHIICRFLRHQIIVLHVVFIGKKGEEPKTGILFTVGLSSSDRTRAIR